MGLHPHVVGGISLILTARFIPYPAFPPYDVKKLHPGLRPTSATYMRSCSSAAMLTIIMMIRFAFKALCKYLAEVKSDRGGWRSIAPYCLSKSAARNVGIPVAK